jgi:hypothetical protein
LGFDRVGHFSGLPVSTRRTISRSLGYFSTDSTEVTTKLAAVRDPFAGRELVRFQCLGRPDGSGRWEFSSSGTRSWGGTPCGSPARRGECRAWGERLRLRYPPRNDPATAPAGHRRRDTLERLASGWEDANDRWPPGCQSWVSTKWANFTARG